MPKSENASARPEWIWDGNPSPNSYVHFRRSFDLEDGAQGKAKLILAADTKYQAWLNGVYIGQGPVPFHRPHASVDEFDVGSSLRKGRNALCLLIHYCGAQTYSSEPGAPGVMARLEIETADGLQSVETDACGKWRCLRSKAWGDAPRRTMQTGFCEIYDARLEPAGWTDIDFDDGCWMRPVVAKQGKMLLNPRMTPPLTEFFAPAEKLVAAWQASGTSLDDAQRLNATEILDSERLIPLDPQKFDKLKNGLDINGLSHEKGLALTFDFGMEIAGHVEIELDAPAGGEIDLCGAELLAEGRPWCRRKKGNYASIYVTKDGRQSWRSFSWTGLRYLHVVMRGFTGGVRIVRIGVWRRQAALDFKAKFKSSDELLNRIWDAGLHTIAVNSQDIQVDCPTREQALYWGDGVWLGLWTFHLTGDTSFLKHMLLSAEHVQRPDGALPAAVFGPPDFPIFDYSLIMIWGAWEYYWHTGDMALLERLIPTARRILDGCAKLRGNDGLIAKDFAEAQRRKDCVLFIDHPGLGWHSCEGPGLVRRGVSAAANMFYILALQAYSNMLKASGDCAAAKDVDSDMRQLKKAAQKAFWDPGRGLYADALVDGMPTGFSEHINALAVISGVCPENLQRNVLKKALDAEDKSICRCGPYFWIYLSKAMSMAGMRQEMLTSVKRLWGGMLEAGATTWWETFLGDELDSLCHAWSCVPNCILLSEIVGLKPLAPGFAKVELHPQIKLVDELEASLPLPGGEIKVAWRRLAGKRVEFALNIKGAFEVELELQGARIDAYDGFTTVLSLQT